MQIPYHRTPGGFFKSPFQGTADKQCNYLEAPASRRTRCGLPGFQGALSILRLNICAFFMGVCGQGGCTVLGTEPTDTGKLGMNSATEPTLALGNSSHITTHTLRKKWVGSSQRELCAYTPPSIYTLGTYTPFRKPVSEMCLCYKAKCNYKWKVLMKVS